MLFSTSYTVFAEALSDTEIQALASYPNWVADDCAATPTTDTGAATPGKVYILGDSISTQDFAGSQIKKKFDDGGWSPYIAAKSGRQIAYAADNGVVQAAKDKTVIGDSDAIVVELGTNSIGDGSGNEASVKKLMDEINKYNTKKSPVYWVNVVDFQHKENSKATNAAIAAGVGSNGKVIDWYKEATTKSNASDFEKSPDGTYHPNNNSSKSLLANLIYSSVSSGAGSGSSASSAPKATNGVEYDAGMTIDTDGIGSDHGEGSPPHQDHTSYADGRLNADKTNYMVLAPGWAAARGLTLGDIAVVQYKGKSAYAVYGDNYKGDQIHGEGSYRLATKLGINNSPVSGGVTSGVHYIVFPGSHKQLNGSVDQSKIDQIGQSLYGGEQPAQESTGCCPSGSGQDASLSGNDNLQKIFNFFVQNGYSKEQAAGIVGNTVAESSGSPERYQGDEQDHKTPPGDLGWGIVQWTPANKIVDYAKSVNKPAYELSTQLEFLLKQLKGTAASNSEKGAGDKLKTAKTAEEAATIFQNEYERPASRTASLPTRVAAAKAALTKYGGGVTESTSNGVASSSEGQQCVCPADGNNSALQAKLEELAKQNGGKTAISVLSESGTKADASGNDQMPTRSSYKLYTAYATLRAIEAGKITWSSNVSTSSFKGNVKEAMDKMILNSDNDAAEALRTSPRIGNAATVTKMLQNDVGLSNKTVMGTGNWRERTKGTNSKSTANDFTKFLDLLYKKKLPGVKSDQNYATLIGLMKRASGNGRAGIPAGIGGGTDVANKPGWGPDATNDVGIVYLKDNPYNLAILTDNGNQKWSSIANIAGEVNKAMGGTSGASSGGCEGGGDITSTVKQYAWPEYHAAPYLQRKPAYATAVSKAKSEGKYVGGTVGGVEGIDCGGFVTLLVTNSGFDPKYNYNGKGGATTEQENWLRSNWQQIRPSSTKDLKAGDVAISSSHTYIYVGKIDGFQTSIASASYSESGNGRAPMSGRETAADPAYNWYRKK